MPHGLGQVVERLHRWRLRPVFAVRSLGVERGGAAASGVALRGLLFLAGLLFIQTSSEADTSVVVREFVGKYRGAHLGLALSFVSPIFLLAIYTLVFG